MAIRFVSQSGSTGNIIYLAHDLSRVSIGNHSSRDVFSDNTTSTNHRVFADCYTGEHAGIDAYLSSSFNPWTLHAIHSVGATGVNVISYNDAGAKEDIVFNESELSNVDMIVNFHIVADDTTVVDYREAPDTEIIPDDVVLSDDDIMTGLQSTANATAAIDNGTTADAGSGANNQKMVITSGRWVAEDNTIIDNDIIAQLHRLANTLRSIIRLHLVSLRPI
jgi:hypothetical protein